MQALVLSLLSKVTSVIYMLHGQNGLSYLQEGIPCHVVFTWCAHRGGGGLGIVTSLHSLVPML